MIRIVTTTTVTFLANIATIIMFLDFLVTKLT